MRRPPLFCGLLPVRYVAEEVCSPVAHRQVVLTIPKRLRLHTRFDRQLLGQLCTCVWTCIQAEVRRLLGRDDVVPGMVAAIWAVLIKRVYEFDPRICPRCSGQMKNVAFLEPPLGDVIDLPPKRRQAAPTCSKKPKNDQGGMAGSGRRPTP